MSIHDVFIKNVKIQNYRSLEDVSITLNKGLNVIIGDNGAGKSNFLKFLKGHVSDFFQNLGYYEYEQMASIYFHIELEYMEARDQILLGITYFKHVAFAKAVSNTKADKAILLNKFKNGKAEYSDFDITLPPGYENRPLAIEIRNLRNLLSTTLIDFSIPGQMQYISSPGDLILSAKTNMFTEEPAYYGIQAYASPLFSSLKNEIEAAMGKLNDEESKEDKIREAIKSWFNKKKKENKYAELLKKYSPISDIKLNENINIYKADHNIIVQNIVLNFKINNSWVPWSYLSDGTIRLFHIITESLFSNSNIILIEEPELGIHPNQLFKLMDFLKEQAGKKQIIISTHSPISLDVLTPDELDQIIIAKMTKKGTTMQHLDRAQKNKAKAYINKVGNLSAYWLHSDLEQ